MAIQAPPVNMIANPYVPDYGKIASNAMVIKNAKQQNELNQKKLDDYDEDRKIAAKKAEWEKNWKVISKMAEVEDEETANAIYDAAFPDVPKEERPKISKPGKDKIKYEFPNGVVFEGKAKQFKQVSNYLGKDFRLAENPELLLQVAGDAGISITREKSAESESGADPETLRNRIGSHLKALNAIRTSSTIDQATWDSQSDDFKAMMQLVNIGPGKKMDPETKARAEAWFESEIARLKRKVGAGKQDDPFGIRKKGLAGKGTSNKPEAPRLYDYSNAFAR